jgi:phage protein U
MALGPFAFEAIGFGYDGVSRKVQTPWADVQVAQSLNQQQWTGPTSEEITIKGVLFPAEFGGQSSLSGIVSAAMGGTPLMLVSGDADEGLIHGTFTIQSVDEDRSSHNNRGTARRNAYTISLKRYADGDPAGFDLSGAIGSIVAPIVNLFG